MRHFRSCIYAALIANMFSTLVIAQEGTFYPMSGDNGSVHLIGSKLLSVRTIGEKDNMDRIFELIEPETGTILGEQRETLNFDKWIPTNDVHFFEWNGAVCVLGYKHDLKTKSLELILRSYSLNDLKVILEPSVFARAEVSGFRGNIAITFSEDKSHLLVRLPGLRTEGFDVYDTKGILAMWILSTHSPEVLEKTQIFDEAVNDVLLSDLGEVYVLSGTKMHHFTDDQPASYPLPIPAEHWLIGAKMDPQDDGIRIFGFFGAKDRKLEMQVLATHFNTKSKEFTNSVLNTPSEPLVSSIKPQKWFRDTYLIKSDDGGVYLAGLNRSEVDNWTSDMIYCKINESGSLEWSMVLRKPLRSSLSDDQIPLLFLFEDQEKLNILFEEDEKNFERRQKGKDLEDPPSIDREDHPTTRMIIGGDQIPRSTRFQPDGLSFPFYRFWGFDNGSILAGIAFQNGRRGYYIWEP